MLSLMNNVKQGDVVFWVVIFSPSSILAPSMLVLNTTAPDIAVQNVVDVWFLACYVSRSFCLPSRVQHKLENCCSGALFLLFVLGTLVWRCLGKPCCCSSYRRQGASAKKASPQLNSRNPVNQGEASVYYISKADLTEAISTALGSLRWVVIIPARILSETDCQ